MGSQHKIFSPKQDKFIRENYLKMGAKTMANRLGIGNTAMRGYMKRNNLIVPEEIKKTFLYVNKTVKSSVSVFDDFIKENYLTIPIKTMAQMCRKGSETAFRCRIKQLGLIIPPELAEQRKRASCFAKGHIPDNKGKKLEEFMSAENIVKFRANTYKKGNVPKNKMPIGSITVKFYGGSNMKNPSYRLQFIKIGEGNYDWRPLHIHNWLEAGKSIPKGFVLAFKTTDYMNVELDNLHLITKKENMLRNSIHNFPEDLREILLLKGRLTKEINKNSKLK